MQKNSLPVSPADLGHGRQLRSGLAQLKRPGSLPAQRSQKPHEVALREPVRARRIVKRLPFGQQVLEELAHRTAALCCS